MIEGSRTFASIGIALSITGAAACMGNRAAPIAPPHGEENQCVMGSFPAAPLDTVEVVVSDEEYPWALAGSGTEDPRLDGAERAPAFVLAQVYETLVRASCTGQVIPALAERWVPEAAGPGWTFTLRNDARFADGRQVTAVDVAAAWMRQQGGRVRVGGSFPVLRNVIAVNDRTLTVGTDEPVDIPRVYGAVALGVGNTAANPQWPIGTGLYSVDPTTSRPGRTVLNPVGVNMRPVVDVRSDSTADRRDLLDRGADLIVTRDHAVVDYARGNTAFAVHSLPWDRTYVLAIPSRPGSTTAVGSSGGSTDGAAFRNDLARDAVRAEARAAAEPEWWSGSTPCEQTVRVPVGRPRAPSSPRRIGYASNDAVGRSLAERLVAQANSATSHSEVLRALVPELTTAGGGSMTAAPIDEASVLRGDELAYVIPVPHRVMNRCMALRSLQLHARWLGPGAMIPLVDTRPSLIARRGTPPISVDWEGTLRVHPIIGPP